jgi:hypothetical protein
MGVDLNVIGKSYHMLFKNSTLLTLGIVGAIMSALVSFFIMAPLIAVRNDPTALTQMTYSPAFWIGLALSVVASVLISVFIMGAIIRSAYMGDKAKLKDSSKVAVSRYVSLFCTNLSCGAIGVVAFLPGALFLIVGAALASLESSMGTIGMDSLAFLIAGVVLAIIPGMYVALRLSLSEIACVASNRRTFESLDKSWMLSKGNIWGIFLVILAIGIVDGIAGGIVSVINSTAGSFVSAFFAYPITIALVLVYKQITKGQIAAKGQAAKGK